MKTVKIISDNAPQPMDVLFLLFSEGYLPIRVIGTNIISYKYIPSAEQPTSPYITISPQQFITYGYLASKPLNSTDILYYNFNKASPSLLYAEFGITPDYLLMFNEYGSNKKLRTFGNFTWSQNVLQFGSVSGYDSPYNDVESISGLMIMPNIDITFHFYNPLNTPATWALRLGLDYFTYEPLNDPELIYNIINLATHRKAKVYPVGNSTSLEKFSTFQQNLSPNAKIVKYGSSTVSEIANDLGVSVSGK